MPTGHVSPDMDLKARLCHTHGVATYLMTIECNMVGSVVSVFLNTGNTLCLCEVEIQGMEKNSNYSKSLQFQKMLGLPCN